MTGTILESILEQARTVPQETLPQFLGKLEEARVTAMARLQSPPPPPRQADELLDVETAAKRLGISPAYIYRHHREFPFTVRQGKKLLFSSFGISKYIERNQPNRGR